jgi:hypothetical protein
MRFLRITCSPKAKPHSIVRAVGSADRWIRFLIASRPARRFLRAQSSRQQIGAAHRLAPEPMLLTPWRGAAQDASIPSGRAAASLQGLPMV